ncbi:LysE/ArgO family amino acid transporter [Microbacterium sediminicola]|uniref:LysE/ArgO family amino acid transporter n=1 Tax=Microbacterium sediminicola TaxID=415210 RepID=A0ABN2HWD2_9MICO
MISTLFAGLGLGLSLIVAIGAQNLFVLRQGVRREYVFAVAAICALSDAVLIVLGVSGVGLVLQAVPVLVAVVRIAGCIFLVGYGLLAAKRAWRPSGDALTLADDAAPSTIPAPGSGSAEVAGPAFVQAESPGRGEVGSPARAEGAAPASAEATAPIAAIATRPRLLTVALTCLALTWLNPHVYLDTVFLLGSVAGTYGDQRWWFALGAAVASVIWFFALGFGARYLGRWLGTPTAWRILDAVIAAVMIAIGISLLF